MRDPHVVSLTYRAVPSASVSFDQAPPLEGNLEDIRYTLVNGTLTVRLTGHYGTIQEARALVEPLLRAWEIHIALHFGSPELTFDYETAELIDRNPPPTGSGGAVLIATLGEFTLSGAAAVLSVSRAQYPTPPDAFRATPDVETLWTRYQGYREGREPLQSMAYFCLTMLETTAGGRKPASAQFKITSQVLSKVGQLTSERGNPAYARKYRPSAPPLSDLEVRWLEEAVKTIIRRVGEARVIASLPTISMNDLPAL